MSSGEQIGVQFVGALIIMTWTCVTSGIMFFAIKKTIGLRVDETVELEGLDASEHGGAAYAMVDMMGADVSVAAYTSKMQIQPEKEKLAA
jgi:ammonia channel protein AmtB